MQSIKLLPALLCAATLVLATAAEAQAQEAVTIHVKVSSSPGLSEGGWGSTYGSGWWGDFAATGALTDSGGATYGPWYPSSLLLLQGNGGTIRIALDNNGSWIVESGTDAYAYLRGGGTYTEAFSVLEDPWGTYVMEFELAGTVSYAENADPEADLAVASVSDLTAVFDASGSADPDGAIVGYEWDFDGDGTYDQTTAYPSVQHTYAQAGTFVATVRVTDDRGGTDTASASVTVQAPPPDGGKGKGKGGGKGGKKK